MPRPCVLAVAAALALVSCAPKPQPAQQLSVAVAYEPSTLNPLYLSGFVGGYVKALLFSGLTTYDARGNLAPLLARRVPTLQNGDISRDGTRITFHLRTDARWQDGRPLTARDVAFTYRAIVANSNNVPAREEWRRIVSVVARDDATVEVRLKHPYAAIVAFFFGGDSSAAIIPEHLLRATANLSVAAYNAAPVGSGPYRVERWLRGDRLVLVPNERYFNGTPKLQRLVLRFMPSPQSTLVALETGEADATFVADVSLLKLARNLPGYRAIASPSSAFGAIVFNLADPVTGNLAVRKAFALAVDSRTNQKKLLPSTFARQPLQALLAWAYDPAVRTPRFDPSRASALLEADGWRNGPDGIRRKTGRSLSIQIAYYGGSDLPLRFLTAIVQQERAVGIGVSLQRYSLAAFHAALTAGRFQGGYITHFAPGDPEVSYLLACNERPPTGFNLGRYCNPSTDAALRAAAGSYDRTLRRSAYATVQRNLIEDVPLVFLYRAVEVDVVPDALRGYVPAMYRSPFATAADWRLALPRVER